MHRGYRGSSLSPSTPRPLQSYLPLLVSACFADIAFGQSVMHILNMFIKQCKHYLQLILNMFHLYNTTLLI